MSDLHTATVIADADLADDNELPVRKSGVAGLLRLTLAKIKTYLSAAHVLVPPGGTTGQVLKKIDGTDFNVGWGADSVGTGGATTLDGLTDVDTSTVAPVDGDLLRFDNASGLWKPHAATGGSGGEVLLARQILAVDGTTFSLTGLAATSMDLRIVLEAKTSGSNIDVGLRFNNDSGANYEWTLINRFGTGDAGGDSEIKAATLAGSGASANTSGMVEVTVPSYARTVFKKACTMVGAGNLSDSSTNALWIRGAGFWHSTAAINRVDIRLYGGAAGNFLAGSVLSIYGRG